MNARCIGFDRSQKTEISHTQSAENLNHQTAILPPDPQSRSPVDPPCSLKKAVSAPELVMDLVPNIAIRKETDEKMRTAVSPDDGPSVSLEVGKDPERASLPDFHTVLGWEIHVVAFLGVKSS